MNQLEYIARQISKAEKKVFEHYVVTRIWHLLNDVEIKFTTQQYVKRPEGIALTDMYFPQLKAHVEIDENHHFDKYGTRVLSDKVREADIINATGHKVFRIAVSAQNLQSINLQIDGVVQQLKDFKTQTADFRPWDFEAESNPKTYIQRGYIDIKDDVAFRTMVDAANCFGNSYKKYGIWTGGAKHYSSNKMIWFPKLYENAEWHNAISDDDNTIIERCRNDSNAQSHVDKSRTSLDVTRIVFARVKSSLGDFMYRFKGEYQLDLERTSYESGVVYQRIGTRVLTLKKDSAS